jgi:hypothetical protein
MSWSAWTSFVSNGIAFIALILFIMVYIFGLQYELTIQRCFCLMYFNDNTLITLLLRTTPIRSFLKFLSSITIRIMNY